MNRYFYIDSEGKQKGTFSSEELGHEGIKRDTLVWTQGMAQWKRAEETEELRFLFGDAHKEMRQEPAVRYGYSVESAGMQFLQPMPKTWLVESVLVTIFPFLFCGSFLSLLGVVGVVYAARVESLYCRGDYVASLESSKAAAKWMKITLCITIGWILLFIIAIILFVVFLRSLSGVAGMGDLLNA